MFSEADQTRPFPRLVLWLVASCAISLVAPVTTAVAQITSEQLLARSVQNAADQRYDDVNTAIALFLSGKLPEARQKLTDVKTRAPELPPVGVILSQLFFATNQIDAARQELEQVAQKHPDDAESYLMFGDLALRDGQLTVAQSLYLRGLDVIDRVEQLPFRKQNLQISAEAGLATVAAARTQWSLTEQHARRWLRMDPRSVQAHSVLGRALFFRDQFQSAYDVFKSAYKIDPDSPLPEINMALLYEELVARGQAEKRDSALQAMRLAVQRDGENPKTRISVARWALQACEIEMAEEHAQAAMQLDDQSLDAMLLVGLVARHRGDIDTAQDALELAHLRDPTDSNVLVQLALVFATQSDPEKQQLALDYAELNFRLHADQSQLAGREAAVTLAWVLHQLGRRANSVNTMTAAIKAGRVSDEIAYIAAVVLSENGLDEQAIDVLQPALTPENCFPHHEEARDLLEQLQNR